MTTFTAFPVSEFPPLYTLLGILPIFVQMPCLTEAFLFPQVIFFSFFVHLLHSIYYFCILYISVNVLPIIYSPQTKYNFHEKILLFVFGALFSFSIYISLGNISIIFWRISTSALTAQDRLLLCLYVIILIFSMRIRIILIHLNAHSD